MLNNIIYNLIKFLLYYFIIFIKNFTIIKFLLIYHFLDVDYKFFKIIEIDF